MSGSRTEMEQSVHEIFRSNFVNFIKIDFQSKMTDFESRFFIILYLSIPKDITWSNDFLILQVPDRYHSTTLVLVTAVQVMLK